MSLDDHYFRQIPISTSSKKAVNSKSTIRKFEMVIWSKALLILFITMNGVFSLLNIGHAQSTFNQRFFYDYVSVASNVIELPEGFLISGVATDTTSGSLVYRQFFRNIDFEGNLLTTQFFGNDSLQFISFEDINVWLSPEILLISTSSFINGVDHGSLFWLDQFGNVLSRNDYMSPSFVDETPFNLWMKPSDICVTEGEEIYLAAQITGSETGNDVCVLKLDSIGEIIWEYIYATSASYDLCYSIGTNAAGGVVLAVREFDVGSDPVVKIIEVNGNGEEISQEELPLTTAINDFILVDESMVAATYRKEPSIGHLTGHAYRATLSGDLEWERNFGGDINPEQQMQHVVNSQDGAYVFGGNHFEDYQQEPEINGTYNWYGWLVKVDDEGDILWERNYHYVTSQLDEHKMYDLKATSDGGYIFCGEATDHDYTNPEVELPIQQAWVVKVDGCGCLVPGCDPNCVVSVPEMTIDYENTQFLVGPNPASQYINIHVLSPHRTSRKITLHDPQGKELTSFPAPEGNTTYMLNIEDYPTGVYLLSLIENGKTVQTERVVKD
jgi:hypothetical protein